MSFKIDAYGTTSSLVPKSNGKGEQGEQGPQGPQGLPGTGNINSALLFFDNMNFEDNNGGTQDASFNKDVTNVNGYGNFITDDGTSHKIDFGSLVDNSLVEIYFHCDGLAGNAGQANFITAHLKRINGTDPLEIIDIDTRSVEKGDENHISFGPVMYKIVSATTPDNSLCINKNNQYRLEIITGRPYDLTELKLIIKQIYQPTP